MNIKEVAKRARVSTATVSRTINDATKVRPQTAERVRKAIAELNFYPNTHARTLVSGRSRMVGLIVSDITNPFFPDLVKSFEDHAVQSGLEVILGNTSYSPERMAGCIRRMVERKVDGVAIMTKDGLHQYVNKRFVEIFGYATPEEILGKPVTLIVYPDDRERVLVAWSQALESGAAADFNCRLRDRHDASEQAGGGAGALELPGVGLCGDRGRLRDRQLIAFGSDSAPEWTPAVQKLATDFDLKITTRGDGYGPSDQTSFYGDRVPVLHFFTDLHEDYHQVTDEPEYIDYAKLARVAGLVDDLALRVANLDHRVAVDHPKPDPNAPCRQ